MTMRHRICGVIALALAILPLSLAVSPPLPARAQNGPTSSIPDACISSTGTMIGNCIVDANPPVAFNGIGAMHTVTFTCDRGVINSGLNGVGTGAAALRAGCYDVTATVGNATTGVTAPILYATCGSVPTGPAGGNVDCSRTQSPICPVTTAPTGSPTAPCAATSPVTAQTVANTLSLTINPGSPNVNLITFSGYVPTTPLGSCPAGTTLVLGVTLIRSSARPPIGSTVVPRGGACRFSVSVQKKYLEVTNVTLTLPPGGCGGALIFVEGLKMAFGPPCPVSATATGTVILKTGVNCAYEPPNGTPANLPYPGLPADFPPGSTYRCANGVLSVVGIPVPGAMVTFIASGAGSFRMAGTLGYYCAGLPGGNVTQAPSGTTVTLCPTGAGLVSLVACYFSYGSQPSICSNNDPVSYGGASGGRR